MKNKLITAMGSQLIAQGGNLGVFMILARVLTVEQFAEWILFWTAFILIETVKTSFLQNGIVYFRNLRPTQNDIIRSAALYWLLIASILSFLIYQIMALAISDGSAIFFLGSFLSVSYGAMQYCQTILLAEQRHQRIFFNHVVYFITVIFGLGYLYMYIDQPAIVGLMMSMIAGTGLVLVINFRIWAHRLMVSPRAVYWRRKIFDYGKFSFGSQIASLLMNRTDIFMLSALASPAAVAGYAIAGKLVNYLEIPLTAISQYLFPKFSAADRDHLSRIATRGLLLQLATVMIPSLFLYIFPEVAIRLVAGKIYVEEARLILFVLLLSSLAKPFGRTMGMILDSSNLARINFRLLIFSLFSNLVLNAILILIWGAIGAAIATVFSMYLTIIGGNIYLTRQRIFSLPTIISAEIKGIRWRNLSVFH